jgi:hypothetical protein
MKPYSIGLSIGPHLKFGRQWKAFVVMESIFGRQFVAIIWHFFLNAYQSEPFKYSLIFKKFILIYISNKNKNLTIATCITCLIYMIYIHFSHKIVQTLISTQNIWNANNFHCFQFQDVQSQ